jgi:hypothetical protein
MRVKSSLIVIPLSNSIGGFELQEYYFSFEHYWGFLAILPFHFDSCIEDKSQYHCHSMSVHRQFKDRDWHCFQTKNLMSRGHMRRYLFLAGKKCGFSVQYA